MTRLRINPAFINTGPEGDAIRNSVASGKLDTADPRNDGFNYGAGWPKSLPYPAVFETAKALREKIAEESLAWSNAEWELGQAIRAVRIASHPLEQKAAVEALEAAKAKAQAFLDTGRQAQTDGVKSLLPDDPKAAAPNGSGFSLAEIEAANYARLNGRTPSGLECTG